MEKRKWALCARTLILMLPALLFGQSERGTISGLVKDPSGAVVANAKVTVTNTATNSVVVVTTSQTGDYSALSLQAGTYTVRVEASGFKAMVIANISVERFHRRSRRRQPGSGLHHHCRRSAGIRPAALDGKLQGQRRHHQQDW